MSNNFPAMSDYARNQIDGNDGEWSPAARAALNTIEAYKRAKNDLMWMTGDETFRTVAAAKMRFDRMNQLFISVGIPANLYASLLMKDIQAELAAIRTETEEACLDYYEGHAESPTEHFGYYLKEFAEAIITRLKKDMATDDFGHPTEAELFENNR